MQAVKGMVLVNGATYRIVRVAFDQYEVIRVLDDLCVGGFRTAPRVEVTPAVIELSLLREIARSAIKGAKTSWVGRSPVNQARTVNAGAVGRLAVKPA